MWFQGATGGRELGWLGTQDWRNTKTNILHAPSRLKERPRPGGPNSLPGKRRHIWQIVRLPEELECTPPWAREVARWPRGTAPFCMDLRRHALPGDPRESGQHQLLTGTLPQQEVRGFRKPLYSAGLRLPSPTKGSQARKLRHMVWNCHPLPRTPQHPGAPARGTQFRRPLGHSAAEAPPLPRHPSAARRHTGRGASHNHCPANKAPSSTWLARPSLTERCPFWGNTPPPQQPTQTQVRTPGAPRKPSRPKPTA